MEGEEVYIAWKADNAISVEIFGVGVFSSMEKKAIKPTKKRKCIASGSKYILNKMPITKGIRILKKGIFEKTFVIQT